jgi:anti-sigma regulatory factor (Ser/Thr protein kinase)
MTAARDDASPHLRLELLSQPRYLCGARDMISAVARRLGFGDMECSQIALAVDEALSNVMKHGYAEATDGRIWMNVWPLKDTNTGRTVLRIVIEDQGRQVDPERICGRDLEDIRPGGLGVHIIRQVMENVRYEQRDAAGMRLTMEKTAPEAEASQTTA